VAAQGELHLRHVYLFAGLISLGSGSAIAAPIYLECPIATDRGSSAVVLELKLNEVAATADVLTSETGYAVSGLKALFTSNYVVFSHFQNAKIAAGNTDVLRMETAYKINRTTLELEQRIGLATGDGSPIIRRGTCYIAKVQQRKI
jgi:hypothetical protein